MGTQHAVHQPIADAVGLLAVPAGRHKGQLQQQCFAIAGDLIDHPTSTECVGA